MVPDLSIHSYIHTADIRLEDEEKVKWLEWTRVNVQRHWDDPDGPLFNSDVVVIDDPQRMYGWRDS